MRAHEEEQAVRTNEVLGLVSEIEMLRLNMQTRHAGYAVTGAALDLIKAVWSAPHRYCRWVALDEVVSAAPCEDILTGRKAIRLLADKGLLDIKGTTMGPGKTAVRIKNVPPYPME